MTVTICALDANGYFTGASREIGPADGCPVGWVRAPVPELSEGEFARWTGGAWEVGVTAPPPPAPPAQVAMHRVKKAAFLTPWDGHDNLLDAIYDAFALLPAPKDELARIEFDNAPNLVRDGATTQAVCQLLSMSQAQLDELLTFAASLP